MSAEAIRKIFNDLDANHDGRLDKVEIMKFMQRFKPQDATPEGVAEYFLQVDTSSDGKLSVEEFAVQFGLKDTNSLTKDELKAAFQGFDKNNDGYIDAAELNIILVANGEKESQVAKDIAKLDKDGDGRVSYQEYLKAFKK